MTYFFANTSNLVLLNSDEEDIEIVPGLRLTNDKKIIASIISEDIIDILGVLEYNNLINCKALLYYKYTDEDLKVFGTEDQLEILTNILSWIDDFLKNSWLFRDNCVMSDMGYLVTFKKDKHYVASSLRLTYKLSSSNNELFDLSLTDQELRKIIADHDKIENYFFERQSSSMRFMMEKGYSRIARSLIFIKQAREARNLAYKISNFCSAFETIFSTDSSELTYKLSERVSFFLKDERSKIETFKALKSAYSIRSKLTHGDILSPKQINDIYDIAKVTDEILRLALNKIIWDDKLSSIFDSKNEEVDRYFEELIFE